MKTRGEGRGRRGSRPSFLGGAWLGVFLLAARPSAPAFAARGKGAAKSSATSATSATIQPRLPTAKAYGITPPRLAKALGRPKGIAKVRKQIALEVIGQARAAGMSELEEDPRLDAAMTTLAENLGSDELPALDVLDFLLQAYGVIGPSPQLVIARALGTPAPRPEEAAADLQRSIVAQLGPLLKDPAPAALGVGLASSRDGVVLLVALQHRLLRTSPLPRALATKKAGVKLDVTLLGAEETLEALVTTPAGSTRPLSLTSPTPRSFSTTVSCDAGRGRYQLELVGQNPKSGTVVLGNVPFFCDVPPPSRWPRPRAAGRVAPDDPKVAEQRLADLVNEDRRKAGLPALELDAAWSAVARAHSREMAEKNAVAHTSPTTGTAVDRAKKAGLTSQTLLENLGSASTPEEVERGLMASPGHRQNILDPSVKRMGIGVALRPSPAGGTALFVTQLFAAP